MQQPNDTPFTPEIEAIMRDVERERLASEELVAREHCPICAAMKTPVRIEVFLRRLKPFTNLTCLCPNPRHRVLIDHPHMVKRCMGFPGLCAIIDVREED